MRACFVDNIELPIKCSHDTDDIYNCVIAQGGCKKNECINWQPDRAIKLAIDILGYD